MAYTLPSVHIYQILSSSGGAVKTTPDLDAVVIGGLFNLVGVKIDKEKAKSISFNSWPIAGGSTPVDPDPVDPTPTVETLTVNDVIYYDFGSSDAGFTVTGTSSPGIGANLSITIDGLTMNPSNSDITYNSFTQGWTAKLKSTTTHVLKVDPSSGNDVVRNMLVTATVSGKTYTASAKVTSKLYTQVVTYEPSAADPVSLTLNDPTKYNIFDPLLYGVSGSDVAKVLY